MGCNGTFISEWRTGKSTQFTSLLHVPVGGLE